MQKTVYLSPHLDDAILSCGAIIWDQVHKQKLSVEIWTVFAADAPVGALSSFAGELHDRWQTGREGPSLRRREDEAACVILGCQPVHLPFADCIYRFDLNHEPRIVRNVDLFTFDESKDRSTVATLEAYLLERLPESCDLVTPLGVGGHIDHRITRLAAEALHRPLHYYADFPYAGGHPDEVKVKLKAGMLARYYPPSEAGLRSWQKATAAYVSQISTFWPSMDAMKSALLEYSQSELGNTLWGE